MESRTVTRADLAEAVYEEKFWFSERPMSSRIGLIEENKKAP